MKIVTVCGFGVGSSLLLKMKLDEVLKKNNLKGTVETADIGSAVAISCDYIFTSKELADKIAASTTTPVIPVSNFMDYQEVEKKLLEKINP